MLVGFLFQLIDFLKNIDDNGLFKSSQKLSQEFRLLIKNNSPSKIIHQCGSGISACHNLLAMEHANLLGSSVYIGSWSEWIQEKEKLLVNISYQIPLAQPSA